MFYTNTRSPVKSGAMPDVEPGKSTARVRHCRRISGWCRKIGCCDSSLNRRATAHAGESGHPIIRSAEPGEDWSWCYVAEVAFAVG
jgi:ubiquitin-hydrolase Zn-finger-containing protein